MRVFTVFETGTVNVLKAYQIPFLYVYKKTRKFFGKRESVNQSISELEIIDQQKVGVWGLRGVQVHPSYPLPYGPAAAAEM